MISMFSRNRLLSAATSLALVISFGGCENVSNAPKNIGDYLNLRNSFLNPSEVGRFDKANPWGTAKPVMWPILDQLDVVDEPNERWVSAADPLPADIVTDTKEYTVGEGDLVRVSVFELVTPGLEYFREMQVNELGNVTIQNLNQVHVAGLTPSQIEEKIGQIAVEKGYLLAKGNGAAGPQVSVTLLQSRARVFSVLGLVGQPGTYNIIGTDFRLLDALALARDISGGTQPGVDYLYVIRPVKGAGVIPAAPATETGGAGSSTTPTPPTTRNALDAIDSIDKGTTAPPVTPTAPAPKPGAEGPEFVRPLPTAVVMSGLPPIQLAQADLDAALGGARPQTTPAPAPTAPTTPPAPAAPAGVPTAGVGDVPTALPPAVPPPTTGPDPMLNQAVGGGASRPGYIFVDNKWVPVNPDTAGTGGMTHEETIAAASGLSAPRVIRIPINALMEGVSKYNIVIRPGDVIRIPNIEQGEFYMMGHVGRPGVYSITGRKVTLKQAVAAAGGLDAVAIPRRCDLIRRIGVNQEVTVQVDLQRIFDGEQPDIFLKANDLINVGTDMVAPFLAVTRNAYRASYGWGFIYDRNFYNAPVVTQNGN